MSLSLSPSLGCAPAAAAASPRKSGTNREKAVVLPPPPHTVAALESPSLFLHTPAPTTLQRVCTKVLLCASKMCYLSSKLQLTKSSPLLGANFLNLISRLAAR